MNLILDYINAIHDSSNLEIEQIKMKIAEIKRITPQFYIVTPRESPSESPREIFYLIDVLPPSIYNKFVKWREYLYDNLGGEVEVWVINKKYIMTL
jgi:hypothetical protein